MRPPSEASCAVHPGVLAAAICARCGSFACATCARSVDGQWYCSTCNVTGHVRAGIGERFLANLIDHLVVILPAMMVFMVGFAVGAVSLSDLKHEGDGDAAFGLVLLGSLGLAFLLFAAGVGVEIWAQVVWGQSLGKRAMNIKVVRLDGGEVELWRLFLLRNFAPVAISQACGLFGLVDALFIFGQERRCVHDLMCDTIVVNHPRT